MSSFVAAVQRYFINSTLTFQIFLNSYPPWQVVVDALTRRSDLSGGSGFEERRSPRDGRDAVDPQSCNDARSHHSFVTQVINVTRCLLFTSLAVITLIHSGVASPNPDFTRVLLLFYILVPAGLD